MTILERESIKKIGQLDDAQKQRLLEFIDGMIESRLSPGNWLQEARALREQLRAKYGARHFGSVQAVIDEAREERLNDLMGGGIAR
jgi:hypothetical protein